MSIHSGRWREAAAVVAATLAIASCGGSSDSPSAPTPLGTPSPSGPAASTPAVTAQERSDWYDAYFFARGPYGNPDSPMCSVSIKRGWDYDLYPNVTVVIPERANAAQRDSTMTPLRQFSQIVGGRLNFTEKTGDVSGTAPLGSIFLHIDENVATTSCGGAVRCANSSGGLVGASKRGYGAGDVYARPDINILTHEVVLHLMTDGCHPKAGTSAFYNSVAEPTQGFARLMDDEVAKLTEAASKGVVKPGTTRDDFIRVGLILSGMAGTMADRRTTPLFAVPSLVH
jgi:hypothetical protein